MISFNSPLEAFLHWEAKTPDRIFLKQPVNSKLHTYTFKQAGVEVRKIANAIKDYKIPRRSHIALLSKNCAHWIMSDLAIMMSNNVSIPIYPTLNETSINQILVHSNSKVIIIGKLDDFNSQKPGIPDMYKISVGLYGENEGELWEDIIESQEPLQNIPNISRNDMHTIIYTSGTTGAPKGVMHTIGNFMESTSVMMSIMDLKEDSRFFSYLPLAHVAERMGIGTHGLIRGVEFSFPESLETFASDLERCQPDIFFAVPRIWTKFQEKILEKIPQKKLNILLKMPFISGILKKKLKQKLGLKNAKYVFSGAAPLSENIILWFQKIDVIIFQVYGMTEDCAISHCTRPEGNKIGTVGMPLQGVSAKLSPEGEVLIKNNCLMKGYYNESDLTASVFNDDGYFKTGDIGAYDHDGYLTITGRVKDQFKTDKGKYISPTPIELQLSSNATIAQVCIVGTGIPHPIALITLSEHGRKERKKNLITSIIATVNEINPSLEKHERVEKVVVMKEDWNVDNGFTTPTLKVKRNAIEKIHQQFYKSWFEMSDKVIFE